MASDSVSAPTPVLIKCIGISGAVVIVFLRIAISSHVARIVVIIGTTGVTIGTTGATATCRGLKIFTPNYLICGLLIRAIFIIS